MNDLKTTPVPAPGAKAAPGADEMFFLTQLLGARAYVASRKIGKLEDIVAVDYGKVAEVTHFRIARPFGDPALMIPLPNVRSFSPREVVLNVPQNLESYVRELSADEVLLRDYVLDKKVVDMEDREVEVVYDMRLARTGGKIYVTDVDISRYGLLVRVGLKGLAAFLYKRSGGATKRLIPWSYVQQLPPTLGALKGDVKLTILKERLADIHPVDLADIMEELDSSQRVMLLEKLDTGQASDTLEEIDPAVQRDIVFTLDKNRVAQLIAEMTPGQAADIISVLPGDEKRTIFKLLDPAKAGKIAEIIAKHETTVLDFASTSFLKAPPDITVRDARIQLRAMMRSLAVLEYFYIVDEGGKLLGIIGLRDFVVAEDDQILKDLMVENVISLHPGDTMRDAANLFTRYGFRAVPITDENDVIIGVVPSRDVMTLKDRIVD